MAKGHRSHDKRLRNENKDTRPSAKVSYARVSVTKACFELDAIRGKDVQTALAIVEYNPRYGSSVIEKLLKSAIANAENNNGMYKDDLDVAECYANKGPTMKRVHPRAQATLIFLRETSVFWLAWMAFSRRLESTRHMSISSTAIWEGRSVFAWKGMLSSLARAE